MTAWIKHKVASWLKGDHAGTRKQQEDSAYTQKDMFFANMSHEIRTPVNGIVGFTQLLKETNLDKEQDELVNTIHSSSMHLLGLVNDILDFSKINAHKMTLEETIFDLFRQVEDTIESYAAAAEGKSIALQLYTDPEISPMLVGDPGKLSQILINLVSNAIKFTDALGSVDVSVEKVMEGQKMTTLRFAVKDNGIGISRGAQKNIFNAFAQANSSISRKFGGTGLGLAISSELVKLMGGELTVESAPDEGSEFSFTLSFEKVRSEERKVYAALYRGLDAGILLSHKGAPGATEKNLEKYLTYLGIDVHFYSSVEIVSMDKKVLPALLFAHDSLAAAVQGELSGSDTKTILISSINRRKSASAEPIKHCGSIFKPLNFTKTIRVLEECLDDTSASEEAVPAANRNFKGYKALVADDNVVNQKLMMRILENMQMDVEIAFNGEEAVSLCQNTPFDIVFMDIQMPVMDGVEAARKIVAWEQAEGRPHTPIIALTGNIESEETQRYMDAGMDGFMGKPFDMDMMLSYLNTYTVGKKLMHQVERAQITFSGAKALVVEENSIDQKLIERALASSGVESILVGRASLLMDTYREDTYHILFISAAMPRISASALIQEIRSYEAEKGWDAVPIVIIVSDNASETACSEYREAGANGCLQRPLDIDEIKQELDRCMDYTHERSGTAEETSSEILAFLRKSNTALPTAVEITEEHTAAALLPKEAAEKDTAPSETEVQEATAESVRNSEEESDTHDTTETVDTETEEAKVQDATAESIQETEEGTDSIDLLETEEDTPVTEDLLEREEAIPTEEEAPTEEAEEKAALPEEDAPAEEAEEKIEAAIHTILPSVSEAVAEKDTAPSETEAQEATAESVHSSEEESDTHDTTETVDTETEEAKVQEATAESVRNSEEESDTHDTTETVDTETEEAKVQDATAESIQETEEGTDSIDLLETEEDTPVTENLPEREEAIPTEEEAPTEEAEEKAALPEEETSPLPLSETRTNLKEHEVVDMPNTSLEREERVSAEDTSADETLSPEKETSTDTTEKPAKSDTTVNEVEVVKIGETRHVVQYIDI